MAESLVNTLHRPQRGLARTAPSLLRCRMRVAQAKLTLRLVHVVARERQHLLVFGQLQLEDHQVLVAEARLGGREVHLPHTAEALAELVRCDMPRRAEEASRRNVAAW